MKLMLVLTCLWTASAWANSAPKINPAFPYAPYDEAMIARLGGRYSDEDFRKLKEGSAEDYFSEMDKGLTLPQNLENLKRQLEVYVPGITQQQAQDRVVRGRNNWIVWSGGNDKLWDELSRATFGNIDFLKTISNHPLATTYRSSRWQVLGLVNEPCYIENRKPRADRYGLYLDVRDPNCPVDPFENTDKYPGIAIGSRGQNLKIKVNGQPRTIRHEVGSYYGYGTGVIGLRLFPNPEFDQKAANKWDARRYYEDPDYYNDPDLIKPYRVGMTCAFCHVSPAPTNLPKDFNAPQWSNLSSVVGSQYYWVDRIYAWNYKKEVDNFLYQVVHTARPGTLDTSLISSDQINNPRTMNAIYDLPARLRTVAQFGLHDELKGAERLNDQYSKQPNSEVPQNSLLRNFFTEGKGQSAGLFASRKGLVDRVISPRVLKDAADSVGALGALNRVYVNIGLYSEEWIRNFTPLLGSLGLPGFSITPFRLEVANAFSAYWQANINQTPDLGLFLLVSTSPDHLKDAKDGERHLLDYDSVVVNRGKEVFAQNCAQCHSSKQPEQAYSYFRNSSCNGPGYLNCWKEYSNFVHLDPSYKEQITKIVKSPDFLTHNYLSTELRVPVDVVGTNLCTSLATNAIAGNIWDNFSSETYKSLPSIGYATAIQADSKVENFFAKQIEMPGGGRGFLRPPSLISIWSTAPFFNNNSLGPFRSEATLEARLDSYKTSVDWLLNPEKRGYGIKGQGEKLIRYPVGGQMAQGIVDVFQKDTYLSLPKAFVPGFIYSLIPDRFKTVEKLGQEYLRTRSKIYQKQSQLNPLPVPEESQAWYLTAWNFIFPSKKVKAPREVASISREEEVQNPTYLQDGRGERLRLGPIPAGVPTGLLANINLESPKPDLIAAFTGIVRGVITAEKFTEPQQRLEAFMKHANTALIKVSNCPDLVTNKGHYFGTKFAKDGKGLSAEDQRALMEFMKHF